MNETHYDSNEFSSKQKPTQTEPHLKVHPSSWWWHHHHHHHYHVIWSFLLIHNEQRLIGSPFRNHQSANPFCLCDMHLSVNRLKYQSLSISLSFEQIFSLCNCIKYICLSTWWARIYEADINRIDFSNGKFHGLRCIDSQRYTSTLQILKYGKGTKEGG